MCGHCWLTDTDIVGTTYPKRRPPYDMTAQDMEGGRIMPGDGELVQAAHIGLGLAVTKTSVFEGNGGAVVRVPVDRGARRVHGRGRFLLQEGAGARD